MTTKRRCQALTKSGAQCKNWALNGSRYCYTHRFYVSMAGEDDPIIEDPVSPVTQETVSIVEEVEKVEEVMTEEVNETEAIHIEIEEEEAVPSDINEIQALLNDLNETVNSMRERLTETPPAVVMLETTRQWMTENFEKYSPDVIKSIRDVLADATTEDLKDPETWRGIWTIITHSLQQDSIELYERIKTQLGESGTLQNTKTYLEDLPTIRESRERFQEIPAIKRTQSILTNLPGFQSSVDFLNGLPGSSIVTTLGQVIDDAAPKDFLEQDTWSGIWYMVSHAMQTEWDELKARVNTDVTEEEDAE